MVSIIIGLLITFVTWLGANLPQSPFRTIVLGVNSVGPMSIQTLLGWVNWVVPIGDFVDMMVVWTAALLIFTVLKGVSYMVFKPATGDQS